MNFRTEARTVAPTAYPVSIAEAKQHLRVDDSEEDYLIQNLIAAATEHAESILNRRIATQTWTVQWDDFQSEMMLPQAPAKTITSITYVDGEGSPQTVATSVYALDATRNVVYLKYDQDWPSSRGGYGDVTVTYTVGEPLPSARQAILVITGELYENREDSIVGTSYTPTQLAIRLLNMVRRPTPWRGW